MTDLRQKNNKSVHINFYSQKLLDATLNNDFDKVKEAIKNGAWIDEKNGRPLGNASRAGNLKMVNYLLKQGATVDKNNGYALREAATYNHTEVVDALLKAGADVNVVQGYAIKQATFRGHFETVRRILEEDPKLFFNDFYVLEVSRSKYRKVYDLLINHIVKTPRKYLDNERYLLPKEDIVEVKRKILLTKNKINQKKIMSNSLDSPFSL